MKMIRLIIVVVMTGLCVAPLRANYYKTHLDSIPDTRFKVEFDSICEVILPGITRDVAENTNPSLKSVEDYGNIPSHTLKIYCDFVGHLMGRNTLVHPRAYGSLIIEPEATYQSLTEYLSIRDKVSNERLAHLWRIFSHARNLRWPSKYGTLDWIDGEMDAEDMLKDHPEDRDLKRAYECQIYQKLEDLTFGDLQDLLESSEENRP